RPQAIARMRRALREYDVVGIKTSIPFFRWMLEQPDFVDARFHTAYLDELLRTRAGEPFTSADDDRIDVAVIAAAIKTVLHPGSGGRVLSDRANEPRASQWKARARDEALRA
ncbi:MAG TPA: hypothetical protein VFU28_19725, partial [Vicinamibacterales bacterium]|nr:hypothetical protein [Vicinamibacterales bacterium]